MSVLPFGNFSGIGQPVATPAPGTRAVGDFAQFLISADGEGDRVVHGRLDEFPDMLLQPEDSALPAVMLPYTLLTNTGTATQMITGGETQSVPEGVNLPTTAPVTSSIGGGLNTVPMPGAAVSTSQPLLSGESSNASTALTLPQANPVATASVETGGQTANSDLTLAQQSKSSAAPAIATAQSTLAVNSGKLPQSVIAQSSIAAMTLPEANKSAGQALLTGIPNSGAPQSPTQGTAQQAPASALGTPSMTAQATAGQFANMVQPQPQAAQQSGPAASTPSGRSVIGAKAVTQDGAAQASQSAPSATPNGVAANPAQSVNVQAQSGAQPSDFSLLGEQGASAQTTEPSAEIETPDLQLTELSQATHKAELSAPQHVKASSNAQMAAVVAQVSQRMLERFDGKNSKFEIRLDPAELGKIDIKIEVDGDGRVQAVLAASDSTAADALTRGLRSLENALTQAGLSLSENGLKVEINGRNPNHSSDQNDMSGGQSRNGPASSEDETLTAEAISPNAPEIQVWSQSRLDIRA